MHVLCAESWYVLCACRVIICPVPCCVLAHCWVLSHGAIHLHLWPWLRPGPACMHALCLGSGLIAVRLAHAQLHAQLHGSGWVHRDLMPGIVLRMPRQHYSWTLIDFGCAARTGVIRQFTSRLLCLLVKI